MPKELTQEEIRARVLAYVRELPEVRQQIGAAPDYLRILNVCGICGTIETVYATPQREGETRLGGMEWCQNCRQVQSVSPDLFAWVARTARFMAIMQTLLTDEEAPASPIDRGDNAP